MKVNKTKQIKVNHKLYVALLIIAFLLFASSLITIICNIDESGVVAIASCIAGVGGGGIASVVVAWLIDKANCAKSNNKLKSTRTMILQQLIFDVICFYSALAAAVSMENKEKITWKEWADILIAQLKADGMATDLKDHLASKAKCVSKELNKIHDNQLLYLSLNILCDEEFLAVLSARTTVDLIGFELNQDEPNFKLLDSALDDLNKDFNQLPYISLLSNVKYCKMLDLYAAIRVL